MSITMRILDAATYMILTDKITFNCGINTATKIYD